MSELFASYRDRTVMVLGGAGFLGSAIVRRLVALGAHVSIVDAMFQYAGGNSFNLRDLPHDVEFIRSEVRDVTDLGERLRACEIVVDAMGMTGHVWAYEHPRLDLESNVGSHLTILEACRASNARPRLVFLSTRAVYGRAGLGTVAESHSAAPIDIQGAHKRLAELHVELLGRELPIAVTVLRLGNCYGPGQRLAGDDVGLVGGFLREIFADRTAMVFGGGERERDFLFVEDAVDAVLAAGALPHVGHDVFNVAGKRVPLIVLGNIIKTLVGRGKVELAPFPEKVENIDPGGFVMDCSAAQAALHWHPTTSLEKGIKETVEFLSVYGEHYGLDA